MRLLSNRYTPLHINRFIAQSNKKYNISSIDKNSSNTEIPILTQGFSNKKRKYDDLDSVAVTDQKMPEKKSKFSIGSQMLQPIRSFSNFILNALSVSYTILTATFSGNVPNNLNDVEKAIPGH